MHICWCNSKTQLNQTQKLRLKKVKKNNTLCKILSLLVGNLKLYDSDFHCCSASHLHVGTYIEKDGLGFLSQLVGLADLPFHWSLTHTVCQTVSRLLSSNSWQCRFMNGSRRRRWQRRNKLCKINGCNELSVYLGSWFSFWVDEATFPR
jgi:hypothetical protein